MVQTYDRLYYIRSVCPNMRLLLPNHYHHRHIHLTVHYYLILSYASSILADTGFNNLELAAKLSNAGKYNDALPHFHEAINNDPNNYSTYFKRATLFLALNRPKSALDDLNRALELNKNFTSALSQRASLHVKMGNLDQAYIDYEHLLQLEPDNNDALVMYDRIKKLKDGVTNAQDLIKNHQYDVALSAITTITEVMPFSIDLLKLRATCYDKLGETKRAMDDYRTITQLSVDAVVNNLTVQEKIADKDSNISQQFIHQVSPSVKTNYSTSKRQRSKNYASVECAKVVETNPEAKKSSHIINDMIDEYMLNPCKTKIWFVIELCETIQATQIEIANYELFSSTPKDFTVYFSDTYPALDWKLVGQFTATDSRTLQSFDLNQVGFGKFIRVELHTHYGNEHYCPISEVRIYGVSMVDEYEKSENLVDTNLEEQHNTKKANRKSKRKTSAYRVYRSIMTEHHICGLSRSLNKNNVETRAFNQQKEQPKSLVQPQPTQQPVVNRTTPLKPSIFVELSNKVKALETLKIQFNSLKIQNEDMERRLNETEVKYEKFRLEFRSYIRRYGIVFMIVVACLVYKVLLDLL